ncbi:MAG: hypothetical protein IJA70_06095 [Oscillospiraceae bacterium]|nr:hypothetical protein [Oscillospiraceae bacterium]
MIITEIPQKIEYSGQEYEVYRKEDDDYITIILKDKKLEPEIIAKVKYKNLGEDFKSKYLDWYNVLFFSRSYGPSPDYEKMDTSVQNEKRLAATLYSLNSHEKYKKFSLNLRNDCSVFPYFNGLNVVYLCRNGRLSDYFCFDDVKKRYMDLGVYNIDWDEVRNLFDKPLSYFSNEKECGFNLQCCGYQRMVIVGLLFGYPIESTASALLSQTQYYQPYNEYAHYDIKEHFESSEEPFNFMYETWIKWNGKIVQSWRLEE